MTTNHLIVQIHVPMHVFVSCMLDYKALLRNSDKSCC